MLWPISPDSYIRGAEFPHRPGTVALKACRSLAERNALETFTRGNRFATAQSVAFKFPDVRDCFGPTIVRAGIRRKTGQCSVSHLRRARQYAISTKGNHRRQGEYEQIRVDRR